MILKFSNQNKRTSAESRAYGTKLSEATADETRREVRSITKINKCEKEVVSLYLIKSTYELAVFDSHCEIRDLERQKIEFKVPPISSGKTYDCE